MTAPICPAGRPAVVLASGSATRAQIMTRAGVPMIVDRPEVDEPGIRAACRAAGDKVEACAELLARSKALAVCAAHPGRLVIGR
ncbi:hypothetical protein WCLP8_5200005 [uncultured Gammaproteobacteria bacterium]